MSENVESNPSGESPDSPAENSTDVAVEGPAKPFARVKGRIVLPDGKPVRSGVVVFDPIPDRVHVTLPDGSSMIGSRVRIELDKDGRIASDENPYLDIVGCDTDGVTPAGVWSYLIRVSTGGITRRAVKSLKAGSSYDLSDLLSGKEEESSSVAYEGLVRLIDERLKKFETDSETVKARLDELEKNAIMSDELDSILGDGLYGGFPWVSRSQGKPAEQYGETTLSESFGILGRTVIAVDKDLHAVKNGPYYSRMFDGMPLEVVSNSEGENLENALQTLDYSIGNIASRVNEYAANVESIRETADAAKSAAEAAGKVPGPAGPQGPVGESAPKVAPEFESEVIIAEGAGDDAEEAQLYLKGYEQGWRIGMDYLNDAGLSICLNEANEGNFKDSPHVVFQKHENKLVTTFPYGNVRINRDPDNDFDATRKSYVDDKIKKVTSEKKFDLKRINPSTYNVEPVPGKSSIEDLVKNYNDLVETVAVLLRGHE